MAFCPGRVHSARVKRSRINRACRDALAAFQAAGWTLPPRPRWDVTDLGLGRFDEIGLVLVTLADEPEYCEKLMFCLEHQVTPLHTHRRKKEDIICRSGSLMIEVWAGHPDACRRGEPVALRRNGEPFTAPSGEPFALAAGERVTLVPGVFHAFWGHRGPCIVGEVSTANNDATDNVFADPAVGRFPVIDEDEPAATRLVGDP